MDSRNYIADIFRKRFAVNISVKEEAGLEQLFTKTEFKKKEIIFKEGDSDTRHYFIEKGLVRLFIIDKNGREFNVEFAKENQIIGDLISPEPANFNLETIEPTTAYSISDKAIKDLNLKYDLNSSDIIQKSYLKLQHRLVNMLAHSAEENYAEFRESYPDLIQRLPQYHIAAYLGVSPEFLSKTISKSLKPIS